jgi:hypothetical protein
MSDISVTSHNKTYKIMNNPWSTNYDPYGEFQS